MNWWLALGGKVLSSELGILKSVSCIHNTRRTHHQTMNSTYINEGSRNKIDFDTIEGHGELLRFISYFLDNEWMYGNMSHEVQFSWAIQTSQGNLTRALKKQHWLGRRLWDVGYLLTSFWFRTSRYIAILILNPTGERLIWFWASETRFRIKAETE
jgi:hypothetical protein